MPATPKYLTVADFVARLGEREADDLAGTGLRDARELNLDLLSAHLVHADGVIEGYVRARYPADFLVVPEILAGIAHDIARWRLRAKGGQQTAMADTVKAQYDAAMALLRDISAGRVTLDVNGDGTNPELGAHAETMGGRMPPARMGRVLEGW
ncbi:DUF1320 domain-containing protein [Ancylobacter sp. A5.8]|uniref:DUF1320 domain-containing protein n=1 Tax=Ancylobacter gelatini TaxID=2919920 RepID=UPI001F4D385B|nr:DUF1320 domain-containing protein [Ancylobacter gelatini]MCJ8142963.1 DUF1320 domain-containing protein [Ancylobacter gelatini]